MLTTHRLAVALAVTLAFSPAALADPQIVPDVVYGHKDGMALTFDVIKPDKPNGAAVMWIQSGGWHSRWVDAKIWLTGGKPFLDKGYTLLIVRHGSAPRYNIPEATADVRRAARFVRKNAKDWGVDPERLGVLGGSAGGHLSLMIATTGDEDPKEKDDIMQGSGRVAAVVALYPPTDLREWVANPPGDHQKGGRPQVPFSV